MGGALSLRALRLQIAKLLGEEWKTVSAEDKKRYEEMAAQDKERYKIEMAAFTAKQKEAGAATAAAQPMVINDDDDDDGDGAAE